LSIDLQKPGVLIVAALNKWWPDTRKFNCKFFRKQKYDANAIFHPEIWRSLDSGKTWKAAWELVWPNVIPSFTYDISTAPWLQDFSDGEQVCRIFYTHKTLKLIIPRPVP